MKNFLNRIFCWHKYYPTKNEEINIYDCLGQYVDTIKEPRFKTCIKCNKKTNYHSCGTVYLK